MVKVSKKVIALILFGAAALGFVVWLRYGFSLPTTCQTGCFRTPPYLNGPGCLSIKETTPNRHLPTPSLRPYAGNVSYAEGGPGAWCIPTYYAFRYVDNDNGSYSNLSEWSAGISAGGKLVYPPGTTEWKNDGCLSNNVEVVLYGMIDTLPRNSNGYTLNVHRQHASLDQSSEGDIVGMFYLYPSASAYAVQGWFIDISPPGGGASSSCC